MILVWAKAIAVVGVTGAIAVMLAYFLGSELPQMHRLQETTLQEVLNAKEMMREQKRGQEEQLRLMRWICAGVQKNDSDRRNCFSE